MVVAAIWGFGITAGVWSLWAYEFNPGKLAAPSPQWPKNTPLVRDPVKPTLVIAFHPNCPCSRATVSELESLVSKFPNALTIHLLFVFQDGLQQDPATSDLWTSASRISGAILTRDPHAKIADQFEAQTSGQTFLYDTGGNLLFNGGITGSRSHEGDNDGLSAIETYLATAVMPRNSTPVFGCSLH